MVRLRGRLQRNGDGIAGTVPGRLVQFLLEKVFTEDGATFGRPVNIAHGLHPFEEFHPQRHKTRQLFDGAGEEGQFGVHHRFWPGQEVPRREDPPAHTLQGK